MEDLRVWEKRCEALLVHIGKLKKHQTLKDGPRSQTITTLLQNLELFGAAHFNFFYSEFTKDAATTVLADETKAFPKAAVLRWIIDQISYDLEVITRAWEQRRPNTIYLDALANADKLGQLALQPAMDSGFIPADTAVLTYFQKSYTVRLIPYAKVALIGVPMTALTVPRDYLAIPHEVAHYLFRHGTFTPRTGQQPARQSISLFLKRELKKILNQETQYMQSWVEEMFADMYGCLIAGPVIAIDFQDLQLDDPLEQFADARIDAEDPVPFLRPDTYTKTLNFSHKPHWKNRALPLLKRWQTYRKTYWDNYVANYKQEFRAGTNFAQAAYLAKQSSRVVADEIRADMVNLDTTKKFDKIIEMIWKNVISILAEYTAQDQFAWSGSADQLNSVKNEADTENLYTFFSQALAQLPTHVVELNDATPFMPPIPETNIWEDWMEKFEKRNLWQPWNRKTNKPARKDHQLEPGREYGWYELAYADGWVTRGPEPNPVGG